MGVAASPAAACPIAAPMLNTKGFGMQNRWVEMIRCPNVPNSTKVCRFGVKCPECHGKNMASKYLSREEVMASMQTLFAECGGTITDNTGRSRVLGTIGSSRRSNRGKKRKKKLSRREKKTAGFKASAKKLNRRKVNAYKERILDRISSQ